MTIVESIICVLKKSVDGMTAPEIYKQIVKEGLYVFGAKNPIAVVNGQMRRRCVGLDFPTAFPIKLFEIIGYKGKKPLFVLALSFTGTSITTVSPNARCVTTTILKSIW